MAKLDIGTAIAEAILELITKSYDLHIQIWIESIGKLNYQIIWFVYTNLNRKPNLKKESTGFPCSHYICYVNESIYDILNSINVAEKSKLDYTMFENRKIGNKMKNRKPETGFRYKRSKGNIFNFTSTINSIIIICSKRLRIILYNQRRFWYSKRKIEDIFQGVSLSDKRLECFWLPNITELLSRLLVKDCLNEFGVANW